MYPSVNMENCFRAAEMYSQDKLLIPVPSQKNIHQFFRWEDANREKL